MAVELAGVDAERATLGGNPCQAEHPVGGDVVHGVEDELADPRALEHDVGDVKPVEAMSPWW